MARLIRDDPLKGSPSTMKITGNDMSVGSCSQNITILIDNPPTDLLSW